MTKRVAFRERDLTRAIRAGVKAGARVARAEIDPDGRMVVVISFTIHRCNIDAMKESAQ